MPLVLTLSKLPADLVRGGYVIKGIPDRMPDRALYLEPDAAASYLEATDVLGVSDMFRSVESSLEAVAKKKGAMPPGFSAHNFGKAIDVLVAYAMRRLREKLGAKKISKADFDAWMAERGWFCHRTDGGIGKSDRHPHDESWHFNFLGKGVRINPARYRVTSGWVEAQIVRAHGVFWEKMPADEAQRCLAVARCYGGEIDGDVGPLTRRATAAFQRAWNLEPTGRLDARTRRVLAVATHSKNVVPIPLAELPLAG